MWKKPFLKLQRKSVFMRQSRRTAGRGKRLGRGMTGILFLLPSLLGVSVFVLIPFFDVIRRSFYNAVGEAFLGLSNYQAVWHNEAFLLALKNTVRFTVICIPMLLLFSLALAVLLYQMEQVQLIKSGFLLPMAIPCAALVLVWKLLFHDQGLLNGLITALGMKKISFMNSGAAFWVLVGSYLWKNLGYQMILWMAALSAIPTSLREAASVDGAGRWKCFFLVILPNLRPAMYTICVLALVNSFKVFREAYLAAGDYPHESMYLLQHIFNNWFRDLAMDKMAAGAVTMAGLILLVLIFLQKTLGREESL